MPKLSPNSVHLLNGKVVLTKRGRSSYWQARFRIGRKWVRTSTKCEELDEASGVALELHAEAKFKEKNNLPVITRKFKSVAEAVKADLQRQRDSGEGRVVYKDYIAAIDMYLIPFFGSYNVNTIDYALLKKFTGYRRKKMKREPAKSTINTHTAALNRVFDEAVAQGYVNQSQVPHLKMDRSNGKQSERRPDFSRAEYIQLYSFMRKWVAEKVHTEKTRQMRLLLRDLVLILANTGIRYGTEIYNLKWKHLSLVNETVTIKGERKEKEYLYISVNGKTGQRILVARRRCKGWFKRIHARADDLQDLSFDELIESGLDKNVFRLADGTRTINLHQTFRKLLNDAKLIECRNTGKNRTLYSLRHTYATFGLVRGTSPHKLAVQMGTSIGMLEKHYSHLTVFDARDELSGQVN